MGSMLKSFFHFWKTAEGMEGMLLQLEVEIREVELLERLWRSLFPDVLLPNTLFRLLFKLHSSLLLQQEILGVVLEGLPLLIFEPALSSQLQHLVDILYFLGVKVSLQFVDVEFLGGKLILDGQKQELFEKLSGRKPLQDGFESRGLVLEQSVGFAVCTYLLQCPILVLGVLETCEELGECFLKVVKEA